MTEKLWLDKNWQIALAIALWTITGFLACMAISPIQYLNSESDARMSHCYGDTCGNYITLEQQVACYKGCQFATQPIFNIGNSFDNVNHTIANDWYTQCADMCEDMYNWSIG